MPNRFQRCIYQHSRSGESHHLPHPLAHHRLVAMHRAQFARIFLFAEGASVEPCMRIPEQLLTLLAKNGIPLFLPAVEANHQLHRFLLLFDTRFFHLPAKISRIFYGSTKGNY